LWPSLRSPSHQPACASDSRPPPVFSSIQPVSPPGGHDQVGHAAAHAEAAEPGDLYRAFGILP
jgi:hypothetical protein